MMRWTIWWNDEINDEIKLWDWRWDDCRNKKWNDKIIICLTERGWW